LTITPEQLASKGTEHGHQAAFFCWIAISGLDVLKWCHAIPNGGERNVIVAGNLKAEGVRSGVWDISFPVPCGRYAGLYIEMKKPGRQKEKDGGLSGDQKDFGEWVRLHHHATHVCYSWIEAREAIMEYLRLGIT
jgi:hypothetical protein